MQTSTPLEPGRYYHIYNRGNNRENIFFEERNYHYFMRLYVKYIEPVADTFAYCLMRNHFHLLARIKETSEVSETSEVLNSRQVVQHFSNFFNSYAKAINKAYQRTGSLFENRFGRIEVNSNRYFLALIHYIHRNPQRHGFVEDFRTYPYSSYQDLRGLGDLVGLPVKREEVLAWFNGRDGFENIHRAIADEKPISHLVVDDVD